MRNNIQNQTNAPNDTTNTASGNAAGDKDGDDNGNAATTSASTSATTNHENDQSFSLLCKQLQKEYSKLQQQTQEKQVIELSISNLESQMQSIQDKIQQETTKLNQKQQIIHNIEQEVYKLEMQIPCSWNENFEKLKKYKEEHGHIDLPSRCYNDKPFDSLCIWLSKQKAQYKLYVNEQYSAKRPFRFIALNDLGVNWMKKHDKWHQQYQKLITFKQEHGTTIVPTKNHPDKNFANWVAVQRYEYKLKKENRKSLMTDERLELLNKVGFVFNVLDQKWDEMFQLLLQFRDMYGHVNIPERYSDNPSLGKWIERQRMEYQLFINGQRDSKRCRLTNERIKRLEDVGFSFSIV